MEAVEVVVCFVSLRLITVRDHDRLLVVAEEITGTYSEPKTVSYSSTVLQLLGEPCTIRPTFARVTRTQMSDMETTSHVIKLSRKLKSADLENAQWPYGLRSLS